MSNRGWLWKKKPSEKVIAATTTVIESLPESTEEDDSSKVKYVQITEESYMHLGELEDIVKSLNEKLSSALLEINTKDALVKQHAKVAEDAVSGWEKAEAEAIALKSELESLMLQKLTVEDKAAHLDGALKECMRQVRSVKEEGEQKLHDVVFAKTKQWEKIKEEFEVKIGELNQELLKEAAENNALSRSLHERSNMLMKISEEKAQADAQVEVLKSNLQSCEKEVSSLKYELHIVSKELEIRNEEKNMSLRSAEAANKQHLEGVKKIAKLEAECQRLRGLVRKKLPGPAALAQMKQEVESLGKDYGEPRVWRSPVKNSVQHSVSPSETCKSPVKNSLQYPVSPRETSFDGIRSKENEFLTARLTTMEEEMKMLKEALSKRNSELQASRNLCAMTASKLHSLEDQLHSFNQEKNAGKSNLTIPLDVSLGPTASNPPSLSSLSEDGIDEVASIADSSFTISFSDISLFKEKNLDKSRKNGSSKHLKLMDDFLEMEKLANLSLKSNGVVSSGQIIDKGNASMDIEVPLSRMANGEAPNQSSNDIILSAKTTKAHSLLERLQSRIALAFESQAQESDCSIVLEEIRMVVQDIQEDLPQNSDACVYEKTINLESTLPSDAKTCVERKHPMDRKLEEAMFEIREFLNLLQKEAREVNGCENADSGIIEKIDDLFISIDKALSSQTNLEDFVVDLSFILTGASKLGFNKIGVKCNHGEENITDCVDKVTLLEIGAQSDQSKGVHSSECSHPMDTEIPQDVHLAPELDGVSLSCKMEELQQLKEQRDNMLVDMARCNESLEQKRFQLEEKDKLLLELRSQLAASQKSKSLSETQLKCMVESYRTLETRSEELEAEIHVLRRRAENLETEFQEEKRCHNDILTKCKDFELKCKDLEIKCKDLEASCMVYQTRFKELEEQIQRSEGGSAGSYIVSDPNQVKQESEIAAAAEKLAECQETIFLLSKQLETLRSPSSPMSPVYNERFQLSSMDQGDAPSRGTLNLRTVLSQDFDRSGLDIDHMDALSHLSAPMSPRSEASVTEASPRDSLQATHRATRSSPSASSMITTPEKHGRGFSRFFSKGTVTSK